MKNNLVRIAALCLCLPLLLVGCTGKGPEKAMDAAALLSELSASECFSEPLEPLDSDIVTILLGLDDALVSEADGIFSTGATAESAVVIKAKDKASVAALQKSVEQWLKDQVDAVENYQPGEVTKLENAAVKTVDEYLVVVVANDTEKAAAVLAPYFA